MGQKACPCAKEALLRAILLILDSLGIGSAPDAERFGDAGADTLGHIAAACAGADFGRQGPLCLPRLESMGLGLAAALSTGRLPHGFSPTPSLSGAYGAACQVSSGKDTVSGHWELMGLPVRFDWGYFTAKRDSFPQAMLDKLAHLADLPGFYGNCRASGTEIIARYGKEHMRTGKPIVYTSADSVLQIAAHEESFGLSRLFDLCSLARKEVDNYAICRVIARPFTGHGPFTRTGNRRDYTAAPPGKTLLQKLSEAGGHVVAVGKTADIFSGVGVDTRIQATGIDALMDATLEALDLTSQNLARPSLILTNFVDFDQNFGHRRDPAGYAACLEHFDARLSDLLHRLRADDLLCITADHGCDPTWPGSDHTREWTPLLLYGAKVSPCCLGRRNSFADLGQTLAEAFALTPFADGESFWPLLDPQAPGGQSTVTLQASSRT